MKKNTINETQLISLIKNAINEVSLNRKLGGVVKSDNEMEKLRKMCNNGQTTMKKNGKTVDIENEIRRRQRQKDTFAQGGARDLALQYDPNRDYYKRRYDFYVKQRSELMREYKNSSDERQKNILKSKIEDINKRIQEMISDSYGYKIYGDGTHGYHIDTPKGKAYSTDSENNIVYSDSSQGNVDRLSKLNDATDAMMGYRDETNDIFDKKLKDTQRRQGNVQALADYDENHKQWEKEKIAQWNKMADYEHKPFYKKMFSKKPQDTLRPEPQRPTWKPNDEGQFDGYFAHTDPKDYDKDMENIRQRKQRYGNALKNMRG